MVEALISYFSKKLEPILDFYWLPVALAFFAFTEYLKSKRINVETVSVEDLLFILGGITFFSVYTGSRLAVVWPQAIAAIVAVAITGASGFASVAGIEGLYNLTAWAYWPDNVAVLFAFAKYGTAIAVWINFAFFAMFFIPGILTIFNVKISKIQESRVVPVAAVMAIIAINVNYFVNLNQGWFGNEEKIKSAQRRLLVQTFFLITSSEDKCFLPNRRVLPITEEVWLIAHEAGMKGWRFVPVKCSLKKDSMEESTSY